MKRIGLARSDMGRIIATPLPYLPCAKTLDSTIDRLLQTIDFSEIDLVVLGDPRHLNGSVGLIADEVRHFLGKLQEKISCPIELLDERLTSKQADRLLKLSFNRKKRAEKIDSLSAALLLQSWLDRTPQCSL